VGSKLSYQSALLDTMCDFVTILSHKMSLSSQIWLPKSVKSTMIIH